MKCTLCQDIGWLCEIHPGKPVPEGFLSSYEHPFLMNCRSGLANYADPRVLTKCVLDRAISQLASVSYCG
jgi:hypothetical protein